MTQGLFINWGRPVSKKQVREALKTNPHMVRLEATSIIKEEYSGPVSEAPDGVYTFVGPDPRTKRNFYGNIKVKAGKVTMT